MLKPLSEAIVDMRRPLGLDGREFELKRACPDCKGTGSDPPDSQRPRPEHCKPCKGDGVFGGRFKDLAELRTFVETL
jgi:DnaJ-class molecular chaperone